MSTQDFSAKEYCGVKNPRFGASMFLHENLVKSISKPLSVEEQQKMSREELRHVARRKTELMRQQAKARSLTPSTDQSGEDRPMPSHDMILRENGIVSSLLADNPTLKPGTYRSADVTVNQKGLIVDIADGTVIKRIEAGPGIEITFPEPGVAVLNISQSLELTGTPTAPTPLPGNGSDQIATTKYVDNAVSAAIQAIIAAMTNSR